MSQTCRFCRRPCVGEFCSRACRAAAKPEPWPLPGPRRVIRKDVTVHRYRFSEVE